MRTVQRCGVLASLRSSHIPLVSLTSYLTSARWCRTGLDDKHSSHGNESGVIETSNAHCDDNTLLDEICSVLGELLSPKRSSFIQTKSTSVPQVPVSQFFRSMNDELRHRLACSSFGALIKALRSRPDWFIISENGITMVGLTETAWEMMTSPSRLTRYGAETKTKRFVVVRGLTGATSLDTSRPPLTAEDVAKWRLTKIVLPLLMPFREEREPVTWFPYSEKPRLLAPEFTELDELFSSKGFFPPSEVAAVFIHITPTFFVETRHVLHALSPDLAQTFYRVVPKDRVVDVFFKKYPMIFKLKISKFQKTAVKLNLDFEFMRNYPGCGQADRLLRRHCQDFRPSVGGVVSRAFHTRPNDSPSGRRQVGPPIDIKIFEILLRNLPRVASDSSTSKEALEAKRHQCLPLVEWINHFSQVDLDVLNSVPQQRVVTLLTRYNRIFQLLCHGEDSNLFTEHGNLEVARGLKQQPRDLPRVKEVLETPQSEEQFTKVSDMNDKNAIKDKSACQHVLMAEMRKDEMEIKKEGQGTVKKEEEMEMKTKKEAVITLKGMEKRESTEDSEAKNEDEDEDITDSVNVDKKISNGVNSSRREAILQAAIRDDMIGLDDILDSCVRGVTRTREDSCNNMTTSTTNVTSMDNAEDVDTEARDENGKGEREEEEEEEEEEKNQNDEMDSMRGNENASMNTKKPPTDPSGTTQETERHCEPKTDEDPSEVYIPSCYDVIYVRRLPKHIAPRSLSDYNFNTSPKPDLAHHISSFLNQPPSFRHGEVLRRAVSGVNTRQSRFMSGAMQPGPWRWVPVQRIYASLSREQRREMRPYKGLVHFIRLHGEIFALSADFQHVIAHDFKGTVPPFVPTQTIFFSEDRVVLPSTFDDKEDSKASLIGEAERPSFEDILGSSQIPTNRSQLLFLDPLNPLLDHEILCEEVSFFMPDHPVSIHQLMSRLPPILRASLSTRNNFSSSKHVTVWKADGRVMLQKSQLGCAPNAMAGQDDTMSIEDAVECVRDTIPDDGVLINQLHRMIPVAARNALRVHFGSLFNGLLGYPQYFYVQNSSDESRYNGVVFLVERLQEQHG